MIFAYLRIAIFLVESYFSYLIYAIFQENLQYFLLLNRITV